MGYGALLFDPPWSFATRSERGEGRSARNHYETMPLDEIKRLPVADLAARDAMLFMWITDPSLPLGLEVMKAWGFEYKTVAFYWAKLNARAPGGGPWTEKSFFTGLGYYTRANCELCLLGTRGRPKRLARDVPRLIVSPRREHSRKPDEVRSRIQRLTAGPYAEGFARSRADGWTQVFSDQPEKFPAIEKLV